MLATWQTALNRYHYGLHFSKNLIWWKGLKIRRFLLPMEPSGLGSVTWRVSVHSCEVTSVVVPRDAPLDHRRRVGWNSKRFPKNVSKRSTLLCLLFGLYFITYSRHAILSSPVINNKLFSGNFFLAPLGVEYRVLSLGVSKSVILASLNFGPRNVGPTQIWVSCGHDRKIEWQEK